MKAALYMECEPPIAADKLTVDFNHWLGEGSFGKVYVGDLQDVGKVALKTIVLTEGTELGFKREVAVLQRVRDNSNIIKLHGWAEIRHPQTGTKLAAMIMENCQRSLFAAVMNEDYDPPLTTWTKYLKHVAAGMVHLVSKGILHRDLKPENVLITLDDKAVICDFGLALTKTTIMQSTMGRAGVDMKAGTVGYLAPEAYSGMVSEASDVYSYGVLCSFVLRRESPWLDSNGHPMSSIAIQTECQSRPPNMPSAEDFEELSRDCVHMINACCSVEIYRRPHFCELLAIWTGNSPFEAFNTFVGHHGQVNCVALFPDQRRMVSGSEDKTLKIWDIATGDCLQTLVGHSGWVNSAVVLSNGTIVSGSGDKTIKLWDSSTGQCLKTFEGHTTWVPAAIVLSDGRIASGSGDNTIRIWNIDSGDCDLTLTCDDWVYSLAQLSNGRLVAGLSHGNIQIWNINTQLCELKQQIHDGGIKNLTTTYSNDHVISASNDKTLKLWNHNTSDIIRTFCGHSHYAYCIALLPDQRRMVSCSLDGTLKIWNIATGECLETLKGRIHHAHCVVALSDGKLVSGSYDKTLTLWK